MRANLTVILVSVLWVVSEVVLVITKRSQKSAAKAADRGSQRILWLAILVSITGGVFAASTGLGAMPGQRSVWTLVGLLLILSGLVIRWLAILTLKESFTVDVAISPGQRIIERGIYRFVRHPSYSGSLLSFLGLGISFANWLSILAIIVPITVAFLHRVRIEEAALHQAFGEEYAGYARRTRRFVPFLFLTLL